MAWIVETLNAAVDAEVAALPADMRARLARIAMLIEEFGLERMREPHVKHLHGPLWEMRVRAGTAYRGHFMSPLRANGWSSFECLRRRLRRPQAARSTWR